MPNLLCNPRVHPLDVLQHVMIPQSDDPNVHMVEISVTMSVTFPFACLRVLPSVNFDSQSSFWAIEVENIWADAVLSKEPETTYSATSQYTPQFSLRIASVFPKAAPHRFCAWIVAEVFLHSWPSVHMDSQRYLIVTPSSSLLA